MKEWRLVCYEVRWFGLAANLPMVRTVADMLDATRIADELRAKGRSPGIFKIEAWHEVEP